MKLTHLNLFSNLLERVSDSKSIHYVHVYPPHYFASRYLRSGDEAYSEFWDWCLYFAAVIRV